MFRDTWFHDLDHPNYLRWVVVHPRDMAELSTKCPGIACKFRADSVTAQKKVFSIISIYQAHEQNNACIKGNGGAVVPSVPSALRRWMVTEPDVAKVIAEFQVGD